MNPHPTSHNPQRSDSDTLVKVEGVSKKFCKSLKRSLWYGVKDVMTELNPFGCSSCLVPSVSLEEQSLNQEQRTNNHELEPAETLPTLRRDEFWAVRDVSFELKRGECLGLIGRNGAGKSTLLKMLNGIIKPDAGRIEIRGRVGALIELSAGFNPILTGRENIYVKGSVLGFSRKEIDKKFDAIVDFAEIEDFIDTPVQNYSSGMKVRLGFAVSAQMEPDVLIIDEVLAVGDVGFRAKCYNTIYEICKNACVIFVSHSMPQVDRLCSSAIMLQKGIETLHTRETGPVIEEYHRLFVSETNSIRQADNVKVSGLTINGDKGPMWHLNTDDEFLLSFELFAPEYEEIEMTLGFLRPSMETLGYVNSRIQGVSIKNRQNSMKCSIKIDQLLLGSGKKILSLMLRDAHTNEIIYWAYAFGAIYMSHSIFIPAPIYFPARFSIEDTD